MVVFFGAQAAAKQGNFESANKLLFIPIVTRLHSRELVTYVEAGQSMNARDYDNAKNAFNSISGYMNSDELMKEAGYRHAAQYADTNQFKEAEAIYESLGEYKDSQEKLIETKYRRGIYLLYEEQKYNDAYQLFLYLSRIGYERANQMVQETQYLWGVDLVDKKFYTNAYRKLVPISGYADSNEILDALEEMIFLKGQELYWEGDFYGAKEQFSLLAAFEESKPYYEESGKYIILIDAQIGIDSVFNPDKIVQKLIDIFSFENASKLLLSTHNLGKEFLRGTWRGDGYYLKVDSEGSVSYDLPWFDYGDYYVIEDGVFSLYPEDDRSSTKDLFYIEAIAPNCINVYCYKNGKSYTLQK